jgi:hypothetical protein
LHGKKEVVLMKRIVVVLGVAAVMALIAGPVAAQAEHEHFNVGPDPFVGTTDNECNGELVTVTGEAKGSGQTVTDPSGRTVIKFHILFHGEGLGDQGNTYVFHQTSNEIYHSDESDAGPATFTLSFPLVSQGSEDNFFIQYVVHITPEGEMAFEKFRIDCRG